MSSVTDDASEWMIYVYWIVDVSGAFFGLLTNMILIMITIRTSGKQMQSYSYLFLVTAIFDLFFSLVEILTQHVSRKVPKVLISVFSNSLFGME